MKWHYFLLIISISLLTSFCMRLKKNIVTIKTSEISIAKLSNPADQGFINIKKKFEKRNEGYTLHFKKNIQQYQSNDNSILFIQTGGGTATLTTKEASKFSIGDIILLKPTASLQTDSLFSALVFTVPHSFPTDIPAFIRPDWDLNITDTPGGCATETNAYRRILLTWKEKVGPYLFHDLNAHRVRIMDSFSHYHPKEGGFDEFYLVQMALPDARILTSSQVDLIEHPQQLSKQTAKNLITSTPLEVGDLVYLPRGMMHRGVGGVLAQVITVPGFIPGAEIGVDHHLKKINDQFGLDGKKALPYNVAASDNAIIK